MRIRFYVLAIVLTASSSAWAQQPQPLVMPVSPAEIVPAVPEERPDFQPLRPAEAIDPAPPPALNVAPTPPPPAPPPVVMPAPVIPPLVDAPSPPPLPAAIPAPLPASGPLSGEASALPFWASGLILMMGGLLAALFGIQAARSMRRSELRERRRSVAAVLSLELETRRAALDAVPTPPNAEAGVSFVSSVISMAGVDCGFRAVQADLPLLPPHVAANISIHYAAVQRVADFVKGQSMAASVRMLQANRLGGHPCPDATAMREAHVELAAAFRGMDKVILSLRAMQR